MANNLRQRASVRSNAPHQRAHHPFFLRTLALVSTTALFGTLGAAGAMATEADAATTVAAAKSTGAATADKTVKRTPIKFKVTRSRATQTHKRTRVVLTVKLSRSVKGGRVVVKAGKHVVARKTISKKTVRVALPKSLGVGRHKLKVTVKPASTKAGKRLKATTKRIRVRVISQRAALVKAAKKHVGVPYVYGGKTPRGFDCSGFTSYVYRDALGVKIPSTSGGQRTVGKVVSRSMAKPGDIIWTPGHVAIYLGGNKQIDAPRPGKRISVRAIWQSRPLYIKVV